MQRSADRTFRATELVVVLLTAFGFPILASLAMAAGGRFGTGYKLDNAGAAGLILYELAALAIVGTFLKARGWTLRDVNPQVSWRMTGAGGLLCVASLASPGHRAVRGALHRQPSPTASWTSSVS